MAGHHGRRPGRAWFGLRLKRGNSLIGAKHAVYTDNDVAKRHWLTTPPPTDVPLSLDGDGESLGSRIHHFLLPAHGWGGATADSAEAKKLAPERVKAVKTWARSLQKAPPTTTQRTRLKRLAERVEVLWQYAAQRLRIAEQQTSRDVASGRTRSRPDPSAARSSPGNRSRNPSPTPPTAPTNASNS